MEKLKHITQWWLAPHLPPENAYFTKDMKEKGGVTLLGAYIRKWMLHPIKRRIAKYYFLILRSFVDIRVVGITGSAGKTTVKDMAKSILELDGITVSTHKNIDPVYNIPSTLLRCKPGTKYLIVEMGVEYPGDMDFYLWLVKPDIVLINNIYPTHTQYFGDIKGVAKEKKKIAKYLNKQGVLILNSEDKELESLKTKANKLTFGNKGEIKYKDIEFTKDYKTKYILQIKDEAVDVFLPALGEQVAQNSIAAASVAYSLEIKTNKIVKGLSKYKPSDHRMNVIKLKNGAIVIDDSYNNNPEAAKWAIDTLIDISKTSEINVVFGDMLELGSLEEKYHKQLGIYMADKKVKNLIGVGEASKTTVKVASGKGLKNTNWVENQKQVDHLLNPLLTKKSTTLVKGSRSISLDKLIIRLSM